MSVRAAIAKIFRHSRQVFQGVGRKKAGKSGAFSKYEGQPNQRSTLITREAALQQFSGPQSSKSLLLRNLQSYTYKSLAAELRKEAAVRLSGNLYGRAYQVAQLAKSRLSIYAFVALGFASHHSQTDDEPNYDSICSGIKSIFEKKRPTDNIEDQPLEDRPEPSLSAYDMGPFIAKGCNAAVHLARERHHVNNLNEEEEQEQEDLITEEEDGIHSEDETADEENTEATPGDEMEENQVNFDLAIKMMFNYSAQSDAAAIIQEMENEMVPAQMQDSNITMDMWQNGTHVKKKARLKPHPNIVEMRAAFVDETPDLPEGLVEYPLAQPARINPDGLGRNKTLFAVMKRYDLTLHEYLQNRSLTWFESTCLLTQLIEAVAHLNANHIAHRDIKSNNVLLDIQGENSVPHLVLSDFGHCLQSTEDSLCIPYTHNAIVRGGNPCLMAPEIKCSKPGAGSYLDYRKADLWAVGAVAYELFGMSNPFYTGLNSESYTEDQLPQLPDHVPSMVKAVVKLMLARDPTKRITATQAADMLNFILWAPREWLCQQEPPSKVKVMHCLLVLAAEAMLERSIGASHRATCRLKQTFLSRLDFCSLSKAVEMLFSQ